MNALDNKDKDILKIISTNPSSFKEIANELHISTGTVHNRIKKMFKEGVIKKYAPIVDPEKLGYCFTALISVKLEPNHELELNEDHNVIGVYTVTGEYDAFIIYKFKKMDDLTKFIRSIKHVSRTCTHTVLDIVKEDLIFTIKEGGNDE